MPKTPAQTQEHLMPEGIQAALAFPADRSLLVRGTAAGLHRLKVIVRLLDVTREGLDSRPRLTLTLQQARPELVRNVLRELPDSGKVEVEGKTVMLEGSPAWLHRALRIAVRLETETAR